MDSDSCPRAASCGSGTPTPRRHGHRSSIPTRSGGGYYGYKIHAAVCTTTGPPLAWRVETAKDAEAPVVPVLLDRLRDLRFPVEHAVLDKGYDVGPVYEDCESRSIRPVVPSY
jgi:hypothetical protein